MYSNYSVKHILFEFVDVAEVRQTKSDLFSNLDTIVKFAYTKILAIEPPHITEILAIEPPHITEILLKMALSTITLTIICN
jgi:hypothetical protein